MVGYARDGTEAVKLAISLEPDVVLMDLDMPLVDGVEATSAICRSLPARVAILTASPGSAQEVVDAVLELATPPGPRTTAFAGRPHDLLQFRARLAH